MQDEHHASDPWEDKLRRYLDGADPQGDGVRSAERLDRVHSATLLDYALDIPTAQQTSLHGRRIRPLMERLGWEHRPAIRIGDANLTGYKRI